MFPWFQYSIILEHLEEIKLTEQNGVGEKVLEEFELPDGNIFVITDELEKRESDLGSIVRDYLEKKKAACSEKDKSEAIRCLFLAIFDEINSGNSDFSVEFHNQCITMMSGR